MNDEQDMASENPYDSPQYRPKPETRRRQPLPWWARPAAPSILGALPAVFVLAVVVVVALLLPIIRWLSQ